VLFEICIAMDVLPTSVWCRYRGERQNLDAWRLELADHIPGIKTPEWRQYYASCSRFLYRTPSL